jgi:hypothetical protein
MAASALLAATLLPLSLGSGLALTYDASLRLEERVRQVKPIPGSPTTNHASEAQPGLTIDAAARTANLALTYDPRFTYTPGATGPDTTWLHMGTLVGTWRPDDAWRLRLAGAVTRGTNDLFRFLSANSTEGNAPPVAQLTPVVTTIAYQNYDLALGATAKIDGRLSFRASAGGSREGGLGRAALAFLPLQQGGRVSTGLDWRLTRVDTLGLGLSGSVMHYFDVPITPVSATGPPGASWSTWTGRLGGTWRRGVDKETSSWVGAGLALVGGDGPGQDALRALPSAEVGMSHEPKLRDQRLQGGVALVLAPLEDRLAGAIVERTDLRGWITWFPVDRWSLRGAASGGMVVTGTSKKDAIGSADARIGWAATPFMDLSLGLRGSVQNQPALAVPRFLEWSAYLAASLTDKGKW